MRLSAISSQCKLGRIVFARETSQQSVFGTYGKTGSIQQYSDSVQQGTSGSSNVSIGRKSIWSDSLFKKMQLFKKTILRDAKFVKLILAIRIPMQFHAFAKDDVISVFQRTSTKLGEKTALIGEHAKWSFKQLDEFSNQVANFSRKHAVQKGEVVALFGTSSPDYVGIWLGLAKVGAVTALINSNLRMEPLVHSIAVTEAKVIFVENELRADFEKVQQEFPHLQPFYYVTDGSPIDQKLNDSLVNPLISKEKKEFEITKSKVKDPLSEKLLYVYTSGTTGNPKACLISHRRFIGFSRLIEHSARIIPDDVIYCTLPLYHTAGGIATMGQALVVGSTLVIPRKFSASRFWKDVSDNNCTAFQYIGEICRFLLMQPRSEYETKHKLKIAYGQGLRPKVWTEFVERFRIPRILEFYGATEANIALANTEGKPGAIGHMSSALQRIHPIVLAKVDKVTGELVKDANGFCQSSKAGEDGELLGKIITWDPMRKFDGYTDKKATSARTIDNVFKKGDKFFRTGDLMTTDEEGFIYFVDRLGDTYRWKGENISSSEVEAVVSKVCRHTDAAAYGVTIPGTEGKAGMVCIVPHESPFNVSWLREELKMHLPSYAVPVFIRLTTKLDMTGTFKLQKTLLKENGFNPEAVGKDKIFYLNQFSNSYELLDKKAYTGIMEQTIRF